MKKITVLTLLLAMASALPAADAKWFSKDKEEPPEELKARQVQTFQPPPVDALERYCEPLRQKAVLMNSQPAVLRALNKPRIAWLRREHEKCKERIMLEEMEYLRHVDIRQPPSLPKIDSMTPAQPSPGLNPTPGSGP